SWRRGVDFYNEGLLLWLEVDTILRQESKGTKSLDDFCRLFHGGEGGRPWVRPYTFDELVEALQATVPYDWRKHLTERVTSLSPDAPTGGIARGGWKLALSDAPSPLYTVRQGTDKAVDFTTSIGLLLKEDGSVTDLVPGKAADRAKLGPGMKVIAVNGRKWSSDLLREAVAGTKNGGTLELLVENGQFIKSHGLDYREGEKYPRLEREEGNPDLISEILKPRQQSPQK
ncbi:MAG TPA: M61 family peptidase, partial [Planctomycetota bacterium]|nr:M61 family peptidase [Planctomycetota bacterium]